MSDFSDLTIVIPTLNEGKNIRELLGSITGRYRGISVIVSDDGSTDGTKEAVAKTGKSNKRIRFLDRKNRKIHGLTASVIDATMLVKTEKMIVMDADMQHPYEKIRGMHSKLERYDVVIGARRRIKNWGIQRRIVSKTVSSFAYVVFSIRGKPTCSDMMTGFFGIRTALFKSIIRGKRSAFVYSGYKVLLDILRIAGRNANIGEIEYNTFHERKYGASKLSLFGMNRAADTLRSILR